MSGQASTSRETVTLQDFGRYLRRLNVSPREITREKGVLATYFKFCKHEDRRPRIRCRICGLSWYECPHKAFDSPIFDRDDLIAAFHVTSVGWIEGMGPDTKTRVYGWLGIVSYD